MDDYISRKSVTVGLDYIINGLNKLITDDTPNDVYTDIKNQVEEIKRGVLNIPPADVQPVVRCSECANNYSTPHNPMCDYMDATLYPDSFCSKGKPKEVDCTDCIKNGGDWECDNIHCHKGVS